MCSHEFSCCWLCDRFWCLRLTPVGAVSGPPGLWWRVHLVRIRQEVEALQGLLGVVILTGVHTGWRWWRRRWGLFSHNLRKSLFSLLSMNILDQAKLFWRNKVDRFLTVLDSTLVLSFPSLSSSSSSSLKSAFSMNLKASSTALVSESSAFLHSQKYFYQNSSQNT